MKAIVLAAGKGTRLKSVVDSIPKPMVPIDGKPILEHIIQRLKFYGIEEIYINLHHLPHIIQGYFGDGHQFGVNITYSFEPEILGTAGGVKNLGKYIGSSQFIVIYGDNYFDYDLSKIIAFHHKKKGLATIVLYEKEDVSLSGIAQINKQNRIIRFIEKPKQQDVVSHLVNAGIYVFNPEIFDYIPSYYLADFGNDIFPKLIKENKSLYGIVVEGKLIAVDTPFLYQLAKE
ncbi:MAG: nucleotidyltransferase family protein [Nitrospirota bacterium]